MAQESSFLGLEIEGGNFPGEGGGNLFVGVGQNDYSQLVVREPLKAGGETRGRAAMADIFVAFNDFTEPAEPVFSWLAVVQFCGGPHQLLTAAVENAFTIESGVPFCKIA